MIYRLRCLLKEASREDFANLVTSGDLVKRHLQKLVSEAAPARLRCLYISHEEHAQRGTWSPEELRTLGLELVATVEECDFILANGVQARARPQSVA